MTPAMMGWGAPGFVADGSSVALALWVWGAAGVGFVLGAWWASRDRDE